MPVNMTKSKDGTLNASVTCDRCGEPLTVVNRHGMFCKNRCFEEESIAAESKIEELMASIMQRED